jgi:drug/metabolite transporter (DMT)-like permease
VPLYGVLWGVLLLGEKLSAGTIAGLVIILSSTMMITEMKIKLPFSKRLRKAE